MDAKNTFTLEDLQKADIITGADAERLEVIRAERICMENGVPEPIIKKRQRGASIQYYCNIPRAYSSTGERRQITGKTEGDVAAAYRKEIAGFITSQRRTAGAKAQTVAGIVSQYIKAVSPADGVPGGIKPQTAAKYECVARKHIYGTDFGNIPIEALTLEDCEKFTNGLYGKGITYQYAAQIKGLVDISFKYAVRHEKMERNYMDGLKLNSKLFTPTDKESGAWTDEEILTMWKASLDDWAGKQKHIWSAAYMFQIFTGLRVGELLAITVDDIDFEDETLNVDKTLAQYYDPKTKTTVTCISTPKSLSGRRTIQLTEQAVFWAHEVLKRNKQTGRTGGHFIEGKNGEPPIEQVMLHKMRSFCKTCGLEYKATHICRRTYATMLIDAGVPLPVVSKDLGHTNTSTTQNSYHKARAHENETRQQRAEALAKFKVPEPNLG